MHYPKDLQNFPAGTHPRWIRLISSRSWEALMWPFLFTSSSQDVVLRKPALASVGAVPCRQIGSWCVLVVTECVYFHVKHFPSAFCHSESKGCQRSAFCKREQFCSHLQEAWGLWHSWRAGINLPALSFWRDNPGRYPAHPNLPWRWSLSKSPWKGDGVLGTLTISPWCTC